jgi:E3 ubiquitin-protein ligase synoviolin
VVLYGLFIVIMVRIYTLPLFAVRPMYLTARAFKKAFNDVILSRRAIHNMNTWYPDATPEELENTDNVCIICREEMVAASTKKLPCNHIFHKNCLRSWFQRQQTCPTCRLDVLRAPLPGQQQARRPQQQRQPQGQQPAQQQPAAVPQPNAQQLLAQFLAANGRIQIPAQVPQQPPPASSGASTGVSSGVGTTSGSNQLRISL